MVIERMNDREAAYIRMISSVDVAVAQLEMVAALQRRATELQLQSLLGREIRVDWLAEATQEICELADEILFRQGET